MPTYKITMAREEILVKDYTILTDSEASAKQIAKREFFNVNDDQLRLVHTDEWVQDIYELEPDTPEQLALNL